MAQPSSGSPAELPNLPHDETVPEPVSESSQTAAGIDAGATVVHAEHEPAPPNETVADKSQWWRVAALAAVVVLVGLWQGWALLAVIGSFVVMIFLHELGHFLTAKWGGMKVTQFFLGFGPTLWSFRRGETEYGIKAIPAGAFVRVPGMMRDEPVDPVDEPRTYRQARFSRRVIFAAAGSATHFMLALVLLFGHAFFVGDLDPTKHSIDYVFDGSSADVAGIKVGDRVISVDGVPIETDWDLGTEVRKSAGKTVPIVVDRGGSRLTLTADLGSRLQIIGTVGEDVDIFFTPDGVLITPREGGLVQDAGILETDRVKTINGVPIVDPADVVTATKQSKDGRLAIGLERSGAPVDVALDLGKAVATTEPMGQIGVRNVADTVTSGVGDSAKYAFSTFWTMGTSVITDLPKALNPANLLKLFTRAATTSPIQTDPVDVPTPAAQVEAQSFEENSTRPLSLVGSVDLVTSLTEQDWGQLFFWMATMNLFIGVFNLIPLLPFDGGHIALACYEKVREALRSDGKRYLVDPARVYPVAAVVVGLMGLLFLSSMYLDVVDPIRLG